MENIHMTQTLPRGLRNNNPGNLDKGQDWQGLADEQSDSRFCTFSTLSYGCRALLKTLVTYHTKYGINTVSGIINRWAPPVENDTESYINSVCDHLGCEPDQEIDFSRDVYVELGKAIARHENGKIADTYISDDTWNEAADLASL